MLKSGGRFGISDEGQKRERLEKALQKWGCHRSEAQGEWESRGKTYSPRNRAPPHQPNDSRRVNFLKRASPVTAFSLPVINL